MGVVEVVEVVGWHEGSSTLNSSQHTERPSAKAPARSCQPARNSRRHSEEAEKTATKTTGPTCIFSLHTPEPQSPRPTHPASDIPPILLPLSQASLAGRSVSFTPTYHCACYCKFPYFPRFSQRLTTSDHSTCGLGKSTHPHTNSIHAEGHFSFQSAHSHNF